MDPNTLVQIQVGLYMDLEALQQAIEERTGDRSELSEGAERVGRNLAHLPD